MHRPLPLRAFLPLSFLAFTAACSSGSGSTNNPTDGAVPPDVTTDVAPDDVVVIPDAPTEVPPGTASCTLTKKGTAGLAIKGTLLAPSGVIAGEVFIDGTGKIACAAATCATTAGYDGATQLDCPNGVISPGLINAHDHTDYNGDPPIPTAKTRWTHRSGWRTGAGGEPKLSPSPKPSSDVKVLATAELRFVMGGATSVNGSGGAPGLLRNVAAFTNPAWTEGLTGGTAFFDTFPLGDQAGGELTSGCAYPKVRAAGTAFGGPAYTPHISEGINLAAENEFLCLSSGAIGLVTAKTAIIHAVGLNAKDVDAIAKANAKVIWSPRSNIDLYGNTAPISELRNAGVVIALGTDWLPSGSMNVLRELACADSLNEKHFNKALSDKDLFEAVTKNGAIATGFSTQLGELKVGMLGDVTVFDGAARKDYRAVIEAGVEDVHLVVRAGKVLFGDDAIVTAIATGCAAIDVCGHPKQACIDTAGVTHADVQNAAKATYPLFFCKGTTPTNEPTCVPYRDTYPDGTSATDRDGDGVTDDKDDCKDVFNPARPMDGSPTPAQSDVDTDGFGDACDAKPLDATAH